MLKPGDIVTVDFPSVTGVGPSLTLGMCKGE